MTKLLALPILLLLSTHVLAQNQYSWDVVIDSLDGSKTELFSKSKMFVAENWKSATDVIKNEDREAGLLLVKGKTPISILQNGGFVTVTHTFDHTVKIYHKDGRCRIKVSTDGESSVRADPPATMGSWKTIADISQPFLGVWKQGLTKNGYAEIQERLSKELELTVKSYEAYMRTIHVVEDDW